ncbi:MAG: metalloregulator ArsR/SmtB family transcription factor [Arenicellales bacterium]
MNVDKTAKALKELGHPVRLKIFRLLVKSGKQGLPVGSLQQALNIPNSTLSHHIAKLSSVSLVVQKRAGRTLFCLPQYTVLDQIITFLKDECCANESEKHDV